MKKALLPLLLLFSISISSQVVYTNIPDTTFQGALIDIDGDGNSDVNFGFNLTWQPYPYGPTYYNFIWVPVGTSNEILCDAHIPSALPVWVNVGASSTDWDAYYHMRLDYNGSGLWMNEGIKFVGVHFLIGSAYHYGWIRMSHGFQTITIYDYAYELQPETAIATAAGSPDAVAENNPVNMLKVYSSERNIFIQQMQSAEMLHIAIYNSSGQLIYEENTNQASVCIEIESGKTGLYFIEVQSKGVIKRQKLLLY